MDVTTIDSKQTCDSGDSETWQIIKYSLQLFYVLPFGILYIWFLMKIAKKSKNNNFFDDSYFNIYFADGIVLWRNHINKVVIIGVLIFPAVLLVPILLSQTFLYVYTGQALIVQFPNPSWAKLEYARLLVGIPALIFIVFTNIATIFNLSKLNNRLKSIEISMCIATGFISIGLVVIISIQIVLVIYPLEYLYYKPDLVRIMLVTQQLCDDFYKLSGPIVLLILDKNVRRAVFRRGSVTLNSNSGVHSTHPMFNKMTPVDETTHTITK